MPPPKFVIPNEVRDLQFAEQGLLCGCPILARSLRKGGIPRPQTARDFGVPPKGCGISRAVLQLRGPPWGRAHLNLTHRSISIVVDGRLAVCDGVHWAFVMKKRAGPNPKSDDTNLGNFRS